MKVSVIIPFYNRIDWTLEAIASVCNQTYQDIEIILVDDGSTADITAIEKICDNNSIKLFRQFNRGQGSARNLGIHHATGTYICFLDSDDTFLPRKIEAQLNFMLNNNWLASHTSYSRSIGGIVSSGATDVMLPSAITNCCCATPTFMVKTSFLLQNGLKFPTSFCIGEDTCFFLSVCKLTTIWGINLPFTNVRVHSHFSASNGIKQEKGFQSILDYIYNDPILRTYTDQVNILQGILCDTKVKNAQH